MNKASALKFHLRYDRYLGCIYLEFVPEPTTYGDPERGVIVATPPSSQVSVLYLPVEKHR